MRLTIAIAWVTLALSANAALAAPGEAIGSAVTVVNYVTASLDTDRRQLESGDDVRQQELIEVDPDGRSELELNDRTKLALGPGSRLLLDKFVYDPDLSGGAIVMNLLKGTFRFMTGIAAKPAYVIRTPAAAITVRGTIFDVFVINSDETWLLLSEGAVEVCLENGNCLLHDQPGKIIRITRDDIDSPAKWAKLRKGDTDFNDAFPFIVRPPHIDPSPVFTRADIVFSDDEEKEPEVYKEDEKPTKVKPPRHDNDDDYTPPRKKKQVEYQREEPVYIPKRRFPRHVDYEYRPHRPHFPRSDYDRPSRVGRVLKKGAKAAVAVGVGVGIGYGIGKLLKRRY